jgi:DNA-binding HxlR family transcriptional regulator
VKSYHQLCGLALALDVVGDRWNLLIVRELLVRDQARYTDLRDGLPGIATNLLADRLRDLETAGVVDRVPPPDPGATPRFRLTGWGRQLRPVLDALAVWGGPRVAAASGEEEFRSRWLVIPAESLLADSDPAAGPATIEIRTGDEPVSVRVAEGAVRAAVGAVDGEPDLVLTGPPRPILGVLSGALDAERAAGYGVSCRGDHTLLGRVVPARSQPPE